MATRTLRRGLPRVAGGEPWPPGDAEGVLHHAEAPDAAPVQERVPEVGAATASAPMPAPAADIGPSELVGMPAETAAAHIRRGLPRVPGGEPWPPTGAAPVQMQVQITDAGEIAASEPTSVISADIPTETANIRTKATADTVRRGLPRVAGGEPWPPAGTVASVRMQDQITDAGESGAPEPTTVIPADVRTASSGPDPVPAPATALATTSDLGTPLPWTRTVWNGSAPRHIVAPASGRRLPSWTQIIAGLLGAAALGILAGAAIAFVRALLSLPALQDFLAAYPGEYQPAVSVEAGFAPWVNWAHFFNAFLIVLIIRSGLRVRSEKRPTVFWTPRGKAKGKISLTLWFHQALDILWLVNGVIFVVLLFVTGHWARIVPTSWEVFPNALSAALQYVSFDWPHENGWNNYNSLQQLAYFVTVFIAAPLATVTGFRMSGMWPKRAEKLSKAYPVEWARALHFPVMLYFVLFIVAHVALVMLTGFLRNLNHMYASQDAVTWAGSLVFLGSLGVMALGWWAARPLVLAPIAGLTGTVSGR